MTGPGRAIAVAAFSAVLLLAGEGAAWTAGERAALAADGRVAPEVIAALETPGAWAPVVVAFASSAPPPGPAPPGAAVADAVLATLAPDEFRLGRRFRTVGGVSGRVTRGGLLRLLASRDVRGIGFDRPIRAQLAEAVPRVRLDEVQAAGYDGTGQVVAVIDTGIDSDHEDLTGAVIAEHCFCQGGCCPNNMDEDSGPGSAEDDNGHGTRVAGIVASNGTSAPQGGAPGAELISIKVLASNATGQFSDMVAALDWIVATRPDVTVVNLSLGGGLFPGDCDTAATEIEMAADAIDALWADDVPVMAGSGNNRSGTTMIAPACISTAISVSATWDEDVGSQTWFSCTDSTTYPDLVTCFGNSSTTTDIFAPGALITSSLRNGGSITRAGTSYATPLVAACAAAIKQAVPGVSAGLLETALETSTVTVVDPKNGASYPRLDCLRSLNRIVVPVPAVGGAGLLLLLVGLVAAARRARPPR